MTPLQHELAATHGTPEEFEAHVINAIGEISPEEAHTAILMYRAEWNEAGKPAPSGDKEQR